MDTLHSHALQAVHCVMPGGGGGGGGCFAPPGDFIGQMHTIARKNGGNIHNAKDCGISIVMKTFFLYFR